MYKVVITGGHHSSALPVVEKLKSEHSDIELYWFGHRFSQKGNKSDTLEYREITALNIPFYDLKAGKFYKTYNPVRLLKIPFGFFQAVFLLLKVKPDLIVSFGGYLAVPIVLAGWILGIPSITHEQTVVVGLANRLISKFAKKVLISWKTSEEYFDNKKVVFTGLPLRKSIFNASSHSFGINQKLPSIYITGGKTGSHIINMLVLNILPELLKSYNVIHQCGEHSILNDYEKLLSKYAALGETKGRYFLRKFVFDDEIGEAFKTADVVISRSGAHTVMELIALEKPCILIPIPWASHNEQYENALLIKNVG